MANAQGIRAGAAFVELFADDSALQKGLKSAEQSVKAFGISVGKIGAGMGGLGAAITAPLIAAANEFANTGSELNDMSMRTGISVEALSTLGYAATQSGTDMEALEGAIRRMQKALTAGSEENMAAVGTFSTLGLSIQRLMKLNPGDAFQVIAGRIASIRNPTAQAAATMLIFGKSGTALLPMIKDLRELSQEAKNFNLVWTAEEAKNADSLGDSISLLNQVIKRNIALVGGALAPSFEAFNKKVLRLSKGIGDLIKQNQALIVTISTVGFGLAAAGTAITALGVAIFGVSQIIGAISAVIGVFYSALLLLTTPLGLVALGLVGATIAMGKWGDLVEMVTDTAKENFSGMLDTAQETFAGMSDAMQTGDIRLAAKVLFAGLKVEFLQGTTSLAKIWNDWGKDVVKIFRDITFNIASHAIDIKAIMASVKAEPVAAIGMKGPVDMLHRMGDALRGFGVTLGTHLDAAISQGKLELIEMIRLGKFEWQKFNNLITGTFLDAEKHGKSLLAINKAAEAASDTVRKAFEARKAAREAGGAAQPDQDAKDAAAQKKILDEIEKRRQESQAALDNAQQVEEQNRDKAAADAVTAAENDLVLAQIELHKLTMQAADAAKEKALEPEEAFGEGGMGGKGKLTPDKLDKGLKEAAAKVDVSGTFSAAAAAGMGVGSTIEKENLNEAKKQTGELEKIRKNTAKQEVFK